MLTFRQLAPLETITIAAKAFVNLVYNAGLPGYDDNAESWILDQDPKTGEPLHHGPMGGTLLFVPEFPAAPAVSAAEEGSFSIVDWEGYPEGPAPKPSGPFKLVEGEEYSAELAAKKSSNQALHRADPELTGKHIHEIQPIKFGGSGTDLANKIVLAPEIHSQYTAWWQQLQRALEGKK